VVDMVRIEGEEILRDLMGVKISDLINLLRSVNCDCVILFLTENRVRNVMERDCKFSLVIEFIRIGDAEKAID